MTPKPFDIDLAKADEPVVTRSGMPARIICFNLKDTIYPIVALYGHDAEIVEKYTTTGQSFSYRENEQDLLMAPKVKKFWHCVYESKEKSIGPSRLFDSKQEMRDTMIDCNIIAEYETEFPIE